MIMISNQLDFEHTKSIPILSSSRHLVRKGEVQSISFNIQSKGSEKMAAKQKNVKRIWLFLFNDLLVIAKPKRYIYIYIFFYTSCLLLAKDRLYFVFSWQLFLSSEY